MRRLPKLLALDLDETTLRDDGSLSDATQAALYAAIDAGIEVVVASGRAYDSLPKALTEIRGIRYAVTGNGCACYEIATGMRLFHAPLSATATDVTVALFRTCATSPMTAFFDGVPYASQAYVEHPERFGCREGSIDYIKRTRRPVADVFEFAVSHRGMLDSINIYCDTVSRRVALEHRLQQLPDLRYAASSDRLLEVFSPNAGKEAGLTFLGSHLGILPEEMVAIGNADNDVSMLRFAGRGIAVANASFACLAAADAIIDSNEADGVARWITALLEGSDTIWGREPWRIP